MSGRRGGRLAAVGLLGATAGAFTAMSMGLAAKGARSPDALVAQLDARLAGSDPLVLALAALGAVLGALVGASAAGSRRARGVLRTALAGTTGALVGAATYVAGALLAAWASGGLAPLAAPAAAREAFLSWTLAELVCAAVGAGLGVLLARYAWRAYGLASYVGIVAILAGYVLHSALVGLPAVPPPQLPLSIFLFALEVVTLALSAVQAFYSLDVVSRTRWRRGPGSVPFSRYHEPKVAFHVAMFNEPPELVLRTLEAALRVDYPRDRFVVMVLDDSTSPASRDPVRRFCEERGVVYLHREDRRGFKAGALNEALRVTPADVDLIAVLDADYEVLPEYLRETVGHFIDPRLGFLQTPQDYRNTSESFLARQYARADAYFYRALLPSRNEENAIIFCGTMGILRRSALVEAGGWSEEHLCEDAELSIRILSTPHHALYVDRTYGRGLLPATFDAYQKQHHRWAYGSGQILRTHFGRILTGPLSPRQKLDFLLGGLHWAEGWLVLLLALSVLGLGVAELAGAGVVTHHAQEIWLLSLLPLFLLLDGVLRLHLAMRRRLDLPRLATLGVLGMWMSVKLSNARGWLAGMLGERLAFARTDKAPVSQVPPGRALRRALRLTPVEAALSASLLATCAGLAWRAHETWQAGAAPPPPLVLLAVWVALYGVAFLCAPLYAYLGYVTLPPALAAAAPDDERPAADA